MTLSSVSGQALWGCQREDRPGECVDGDSALGCELLPGSHRNFGLAGLRGMFTSPVKAQRREKIMIIYILIISLGGKQKFVGWGLLQ